MKRLVALTTALVILMILPGSICAAQLNGGDLGLGAGYSDGKLAVSEHAGENNTIIRSYERTVIETSASNVLATAGTMQEPSDIEETKELLSALGMRDAFIDELSTEALNEYAECQSFYSVTSYLKVDEEGNTVNVTKEETDAAGTRDLTLPPHVQDGDSSGGGGYSEIYIDADIEVMYLVSYLGQGRYKFSIDVTWLNTPVYRLADSLGACAQNFTVEENTRYGWYSYTVYSSNGISTTTSSQKETLTEFENPINGNWYGSVAIVDIKSDVNNDNAAGLNIFTRYTSHKMHYEYIGIIHDYTEEHHFSTMATYDHLIIMPSLQVPSLEISTSGTSIGIGFDTISTYIDRTTVSLDESIHYVPD